MLWPYLLAILCVAYVSKVYWKRHKQDTRLAALATRAPRVPTVLPFGLEFPSKLAKAARDNTALQLWEWMFSANSAQGNYTAELHLLETQIILCTADPENINAVLSSQFHEFGKGDEFHARWREFQGDGIAMVDGADWTALRQMHRPLFTRERISDFAILEKHIQNLFTKLGPGDGRLVDWDDLMHRFSLDVATNTSFDEPVGALDNKDCAFLKALDDVLNEQMKIENKRPLDGLHPRGPLRKGLKVMEDWIQVRIHKVLDMTPSELETKQKNADTYIYYYVRVNRDPKWLRDQLLFSVIANRDSMASALQWLFFELARHPEVVAKLHDEIARVVGTDGQAPTYRNIKDMHYTAHVINETLRLYPILPYNIRYAFKDTTLPRGGGPDGHQPIAILKDTGVLFSVLLLHRRRDLYPEVSKFFPYDPLNWVPERWETWSPDAMQLVPFMSGPRVCMGQEMAILHLAYTMIRTLQQFDAFMDGGNPGTLIQDLILLPGGGLKIGFVKNKDKS